MDKVTFKKIQNSLTALAGISGFTALFLGVEAYNLYTANDLSPFGFTAMPWVVVGLFTVSVLAVLAKLVGYSRR